MMGVQWNLVKKGFKIFTNVKLDICVNGLETAFFLKLATQKARRY